MLKFNIQEFISLFKKRVLILGIGNTLKSDDGFGPSLIKRIKDKLNCDCLDSIGNYIKVDPSSSDISSEPSGSAQNRQRASPRAILLDAGTAAENYLGKICKINPEVVLFIDVADLGEPAGTIKLLKKEEILECGLTTHDISPKMLMDYLEKNCKAQIFMLAAQPKNLSFGEGLSKEIREALSRLENLFIEYSKVK